jgi:hypothetical protein
LLLLRLVDVRAKQATSHIPARARHRLQALRSDANRLWSHVENDGEYTDRAKVRTTSATLGLGSENTRLELSEVQENGASGTFAAPEHSFVIFGLSPFPIQMMIVRHWSIRGKPLSPAVGSF